MFLPKVHKVTVEEIEALIANGMTREEAEFALIDKYEEVVFPDENDNVNEQIKENRKIAHVYDKKKGKVKRERKPDDDKRVLIAKIAEIFEGCEVTNIERQIDFTYNGNAYSITLTKHRSK